MIDASAPSLLDPATLLAHQEFVRAVARRLLGDEHLVEDVVQDTWQAALTAGKQPKLEKVKAWLGTIARHRALRELRTRDQRRKREERAAPDEALPSTDELVAELGASREIVDAVLALEEPYRSTVVRHYYHGLSVAELARRTDTPESTVASRLRKAHDQLRSRLGGNDPHRHAVFVAGLRAVLDTSAASQGALAVEAGWHLGEAGWAAILLLVGVGALMAVAFLPGGDDRSPLEGVVRGQAPQPSQGTQVVAAIAPLALERAQVEAPQEPIEEPALQSELDRREVASWRESTPPGVLAGIVRRGRAAETRGRVFARRGKGFASIARPWHQGPARVEDVGGPTDETVLVTSLDDDGRYRFAGLEAGDWVVGYEPSPGAPVFEQWTEVQAEQPGRSLILLLGDSSVSGRTFDDDGARLDDAMVAISSRNPVGDSFNCFVWTRFDGSYELGDLLPGPYWWTCEPNGRPRYWQSNAHRTNEIRLRPGEAAQVDFGRERPLPRISGRLILGDGQPLAGGGTLLVLPEQGGYAEAQLDQEGHFEFRTEPGNYRVQVRHSSGDAWLPSTIVVPEGDAQVEWTLPGARLSGRLYRCHEDGRREPMPGQPVALSAEGEDGRVTHLRARTDETGRYHLIGVGPQTWKVGASILRDVQVSPDRVVVRPSDVSLELDFEVRPKSPSDR